jgi:uncharacterized DUF497 family protein
MQYNFEWDPVKAKANKKNHNVSFELAATKREKKQYQVE